MNPSLGHTSSERIGALMRYTPQNSSPNLEGRLTLVLGCFFCGLTGDTQTRSWNRIQTPARNWLLAAFRPPVWSENSTTEMAPVPGTRDNDVSWRKSSIRSDSFWSLWRGG